MDGLENDLAQINALASSSAERLREHRTEAAQPPSHVNVAEEHEKTLAGLAIGSAWDLVLGKATTAEARVERAHKADQYAEIAADTFSSIPKFSAITGGVAHSVLLIDVSGQNGTAGLVRGMALNFVQGAAFNRVSRMACAESAVGKLVTSRMGAGIGAEVVTHAISGGGFGLIKSGLSENSWMDAKGNFSLATGLKNVATGTSVGTLIGVPAGMVGLRVGRAVTIGMGSQVEHSVIAASVQKFATGAGSGFASGSVFGGVDAAKSGKSWSQILDNSLQGGIVGLVTGGLSSGFDRMPVSRLTVADAHMRAPAEMEALSASRPKIQDNARDVGRLELTEKMVARAEYLLGTAGLQEAYDRLSYKPTRYVKVEDFARRLQPPVTETRSVSTLKASAPKTFEEYQAALKKMKGADEPLDFSEHFSKPYLSTASEATRVYKVEGHSTRIVVPEAYAARLDDVRMLRKAIDTPSAFNRLDMKQKMEVSNAIKSGDASSLSQYMTAPEIAQYIKVYQAGQLHLVHPLRNRALPEDLIPILDALPNRSLLKEVKLLDSRHPQDVFKSVQYDAPGFMSAATVGSDAIVHLHQADYGSSLYNSVFHEWAHVAKWQSPVFSKMFDLASVVDHVDNNYDHKATADARVNNPTHEVITSEGMYYPDLHSTRSQDENFAVGMGEEIMGPDPNKLFAYIGQAPVRGMTLATTLENNLLVSAGRNESIMAENMMDRANYGSEAARPYAIGTLQRRLTDGTPVEKAAAAQLMAYFGTAEQAQDLIAVATNKSNNVLPRWEGTNAEEAMAGDKRTVAQHAFDAYLNLTLPRNETGIVPEPARFKEAMQIFVQKPELKEVAADYIARSTDSRRGLYEPLMKISNLHGTPVERSAAVQLIKEFAGQDKADRLLSIALQKDNDRVPNYTGTNVPSEFMVKFRTVAQTAYKAYIEASAGTERARFDLAFKNGLEKPTQRELASAYLSKSFNPMAQGYGEFLQMHDLPGHVSKMQELIDNNFRFDPANQKMVFDQMLHLTDTDPRKQMEIITANMHVPSLMGSALNKMDYIMTHTTTRQQREEIAYAVTEGRRWEKYSQAIGDQMQSLLAKVSQENQLQDMFAQMRKSPTDKVAAMHQLAVIHDQRAIKPLLQQAVSGNDVVEREAIGALQQFNPALVKFYAQELKRDLMANPLMTNKITQLIDSRRLAPPAVPL